MPMGIFSPRDCSGTTASLLLHVTVALLLIDSATLRCGFVEAGGGVSTFPNDNFDDPVPLRRRFPPFMYPRNPQVFEVSFSWIDSVNIAQVSELALYSVIPDTVSQQVYLLFSYGPTGMGFALEAVEKGYVDLGGLLKEQFYGNLRCQFLDQNATALPAVELERVSLRSAHFSTARVLVGSCPMPNEFVNSVRQDNFRNPPLIRILHENDDGAISEVTHPLHKQNDTFYIQRGEICAGTIPMPATVNSMDLCAQVCANMEANEFGRPCSFWQWDDTMKLCSFRRIRPRKHMCRSARNSLVLGVRRHELWDAVETARTGGDRRLITISAVSPVFGSGDFVNRVAQWVEYHLIAFPDAHFFVYARGGDGRGGSIAHYPLSMPAAAGGIASLHPYIEAGVVTVIWVPVDTERALLLTKRTVQQRNENDFLFRVKHVSDWAAVAVDYDEYVAPIPNSTGPFPLQFPASTFLRQVSSKIGMLTFPKWPAKTPDVIENLLFATDEIGTEKTPERFPKRFIRPEAVAVIKTHEPVVVEQGWDLDDAYLHSDYGTFAVLHFRDKDWEYAVNTGTTQSYTALHDVVDAVKARMWERYNHVDVE